MITKMDDLDKRCGIYEIDPEAATELLNATTKNRPLRIMVKEKYARRMRENLWKMNGQPIILSSEGTLLDGQHRLEAVVLSGKPTKFVVLWGRFDHRAMDENKPRDGRDLLAIETDFKNLIVLQAATRLIVRHDYALARELSFFHVTSGGGTLDVENAEILNFVRRNPELADIVVKALSLRSPYGELMPLSPAVAAWFLVARKEGRARADAFFEPLMTGAGLGVNDPRLALRRKFSNETKQGHRSQGRMAFTLICKSWDIRDREVKVFSFKVGEVFPFVR